MSPKKKKFFNFSPLPMLKIHHFAFKKEYPSLSPRLTSNAEIYNIAAGTSMNGNTVTALWDTGAMVSAITPSIAKGMNLIPINRVKVNGVNNSSLADVVKISIGLPNQFILKEINVLVCNLVSGVDMLIGMDIIQLGDFSISNGDGKTLFSFAMPSFEDKTDLYEKAFVINNPDKV
jgi:predicted aspartyl protease